MKKFFKIGLAAFALWSIVLCNISAQSEKDFQVKLTEDGTGVVITGYTGKSTNIVIPSTIQGYPVKEIANSRRGGPYIFNIYLKSVIIPNTVERIGDNCFADQKFLETITLSNSLKYISESCFYNCTSLKSITIPNSVQEIGRYAFSHTKNLTTIQLPNGNLKIQSSAFTWCGVKELVITGKMEFAGSELGWFFRCNNLETIVIEADVKSLPHEFLLSETLRTIKFKSPDTEIFEDTFKYVPNLDLASQAEIKKHLERTKLLTEERGKKEEEDRNAKKLAEYEYNKALYYGNEGILESICTAINSNKSINEAIEEAKNIWKEIYNSSKNNLTRPEFFPEFEENFVNDIYETQIKDKLIKENKKGELILTPQGKKYLK